MQETFRYLCFDCPKCKTHRLGIPVDGPKAWQLTARTSLEEIFKKEPAWNDITISPSIEHETHYADGLQNKDRICKTHFFIRDGKIEPA